MTHDLFDIGLLGSVKGLFIDNQKKPWDSVHIGHVYCTPICSSTVPEHTLSALTSHPEARQLVFREHTCGNSSFCDFIKAFDTVYDKRLVNTTVTTESQLNHLNPGNGTCMYSRRIQRWNADGQHKDMHPLPPSVQKCRCNSPKDEHFKVN